MVICHLQRKSVATFGLFLGAYDFAQEWGWGLVSLSVHTFCDKAFRIVFAVTSKGQPHIQVFSSYKS